MADDVDNPAPDDWRQPQWLRSLKSAITPYNVGGRVTDALAGNDLTRPIAPAAGYAANVLTASAPAIAGAGPAGAAGGLARAGTAAQRGTATANALRTLPKNWFTHVVDLGAEGGEAPMSLKDFLTPQAGAGAAGMLGLASALRRKDDE